MHKLGKCVFTNRYCEHLEQSGMNVAINTVGGLVINIISHLLSTYTMSILVAYETENIDNF